LIDPICRQDGRVQSLTIQQQVEKFTTDRRGALPEIYDDPESLEVYLDRLNTVIEDADRYGLESGTHKINLGIVYGARYSGRPGKDLFDYYLECLSAVSATATERERKGFESENRKQIAYRNSSQRQRKKFTVLKHIGIAQDKSPRRSPRRMKIKREGQIYWNWKSRIPTTWIVCCDMRRISNALLIVS